MSPPDPQSPAAGATIAPVEGVAAAALDRAARWQRQALAELEWSDAERTSDAVRADANGRLDRTLSEAIERIGADRLTDRELSARAAQLMHEAGWPDDALRALALRHARRAWLSERLTTAARRFGSVDPLDGLEAEHGDLVPAMRAGGELATALEVAAHDRHDLDWSVAAALRVAREEAGRLTPADDERLRRAVAESLSDHDEGRRVDAVAERLARRLSPAELTAVDALLAGHVALFAALVADRAELDAETVESWLLAPGPLPAGLAMRASGEAAAEIGGALATIANASSRPLAAVLAVTEQLHGLSRDEAGGLLEPAR